MGNERIGFPAKTSIHRGNFGLKGNLGLQSGGVLVAENVEIEVEVEATKEQPAAVAA